jgi:hypothetical protein
MCFSPTASFLASSILIPTGLYSIKLGFFKKNWLPISFAPLFFGVHQFIEGFIWLMLLTQNHKEYSLIIFLYLFIAFSLWPAFIPYMIKKIEIKNKEISHNMNIILGIGLIVFLLQFIFLMYCFFSIQTITAHIYNNCIDYRINVPTAIEVIFTVLYLVCIIPPFFMSTHKNIKILGILISLGLLITFSSYFYAFYSVWCFFSAIVSIYIIYILKRS